jgi:hypothetical protein
MASLYFSGYAIVARAGPGPGPSSRGVGVMSAQMGDEEYFPMAGRGDAVEDEEWLDNGCSSASFRN